MGWIKVYSYSGCKTCKNALAWLEKNNFQYELLDITKITPPKETLVEAIKQFGDRKYLFNTSGISYRKLGSKVVKNMKVAAQ